MLTILLVGIYVVYGLGGLYTVLFVTRVEKEWFEEIGIGMTILCGIFTIAVWPVILGLHIHYRKSRQ